jgi:hypothetical protein
MQGDGQYWHAAYLQVVVSLPSIASLASRKVWERSQTPPLNHSVREWGFTHIIYSKAWQEISVGAS